MAPQLYLITPADPDVSQFPRQLMAVLTGPEVAALLIQRGTLNDSDYAKLVASLVQIGQAAGAAVLVEDDVDLARRSNADGVHITKGGVEAIEVATKKLKPQGIVGASNVNSRHDAMSYGELDVDYVFFGAIAGPVDSQANDYADWWAETFEVPSVLAAPTASPETVTNTNAEFVAVGDSIWSAEDPKAALAAIALALRETE